MYRLPSCLCLPIRLPWCFPPTELLTFVLRSKKPSEMSAHKIHKVIVCSKIKMGEKSLSLVVIVVVESDFAIQLDILSLVVRLEWYLPNENEHRQPLVFYCSLTTGLPKNTLPRAISSITERKSQEFPTLSIIFFSLSLSLWCFLQSNGSCELIPGGREEKKNEQRPNGSTVTK